MISRDMMPIELLTLVDPLEHRVANTFKRFHNGSSFSWLEHFYSLPPANFFCGVSNALLVSFDKFSRQLPKDLSISQVLTLVEIKQDLLAICRYINSGDETWINKPTHDALFQDFAKKIRGGK